ncbi:hypothetical protein AB1Y20_009435 [Prymnesium parvum]|uniref:Uncharacterized protein n=1 Tax=Prymnesium parvum TaxID=97485 RepID=A0AB34K6H4_PRYPA
MSRRPARVKPTYQRSDLPPGLYVADRRLVHKTLPGTSGVGTRVRMVRRLGTETDSFDYDILNMPRRLPPATLAPIPRYEDHIGEGNQIVSRPMPVWPGRLNRGAHDVPPPPRSLPRSLSTADIDGATPKSHANRILDRSMRRQFNSSLDGNDASVTSSFPQLPRDTLTIDGHRRKVNS